MASWVIDTDALAMVNDVLCPCLALWTFVALGSGHDPACNTEQVCSISGLGFDIS